MAPRLMWLKATFAEDRSREGKGLRAGTPECERIWLFQLWAVMQ